LKKLKDINITHISLVKDGANGKEIIYKSEDTSPVYTKEINISKSNIEKGIVYGIVYSPDEIDTQGDFTDINEIEKASYNFMKSKNILNVDTNHDFNNKEAFVCESWILKGNDPVFPNEKIGSWAVGIKLEDEELKKSVKNKEIKALSMAGICHKEEVIKVDNEAKEETKIVKDDFIQTFKKALAVIVKEQKEEIKKKNSNTEVQDLLEKNQELKEKIYTLEKEYKDVSLKLEDVSKQNSEILEALHKSRQNNKIEEQTNNIYKGIL